MVITDKSRGSGEAFEFVLVSDRFEGLSHIHRHQWIFKLLGKSVMNRIKELYMACYTSDEWEAQGKPGEDQRYND